jgi:hypothetical protein
VEPVLADGRSRDTRVELQRVRRSDTDRSLYAAPRAGVLHALRARGGPREVERPEPETSGGGMPPGGATIGGAAGR